MVTSIEKGIKPYTSFTRDKQAVRSLPFHLNDTVNFTCLAARGNNFCNDIKTLFKHTHIVILSDTRLGSWRSYQAFLVTQSCCIYLLILNACFYMSSQVMPTGVLREAESSKSEFHQFALTISNHPFLLCSTGILGSTSRLPQTSPLCMLVWNRGLRVSVTSCYTQQLLHLGGVTPSATV